MRVDTTLPLTLRIAPSQTAVFFLDGVVNALGLIKGVRFGRNPDLHESGDHDGENLRIALMNMFIGNRFVPLTSVCIVSMKLNVPD